MGRLPPLRAWASLLSSSHLTNILGQVAGSVVHAAPLFLIFLQHSKKGCSGLSLQQGDDQQKSGTAWDLDPSSHHPHLDASL